jgi:hypothetical protein
MDHCFAVVWNRGPQFLPDQVHQKEQRHGNEEEEEQK